MYANRRVAGEYVIEVESQNFPRAKAMQNHETYDGEIARVREAMPETVDLVHGQRSDYSLRRFHSQLTESRTPPSDAERRTAAVPMLEVWRGLGDGVGAFQAQDALGNGYPAIDAGGRGRRILSGLEANVLEQASIR